MKQNTRPTILFCRPQRAARKVICALSLAAAVAGPGCDFPYSPVPQPDPYGADTSLGGKTFSGDGTVYAVNISQQSCNPSIAPGGPYNGCMLFLGYNRITVSVPDSLSAYRTGAITVHDRLTIVDTANVVRWFMRLDDFSDDIRELQCPEWTTHQDYIVCLGGQTGADYDGYVVRLSDRGVLRFADNTFEEFSTPHIWTPDAIDDAQGGFPAQPFYGSAGFCDSNAIKTFFGTDSVRIVWTTPSDGGTVRYTDYAAEGGPIVRQLAKPVGREGWYCASPLVSPDGKWVAYHAYSASAMGPLYSCYIQRLSDGSAAKLIADGASDPHWWNDPTSGAYYIVYAVTPGAYFNEHDFLDADVMRDENPGYTMKQRLRGSPDDVPAHIGTLDIDVAALPDTLISLPFKGGMSRDGRYLATAYCFAYIAALAGD